MLEIREIKAKSFGLKKKLDWKCREISIKI